MASVIQTLGPNAYGGFMEMVGEGQDAVTHKALVRFLDVDVAVDSYVKVYCTKAAPKGLVNELIGYSLAKWGGLLTAPRAAVLLLDAEQTTFLPPHVSPPLTEDGKVIAWCVQSLAGKTPKQSYILSTDKAAALKSIQQDFKKWKDLAAVASMDAWLLNEDRNLGNVVRLGEGQYAVIDHGWACTGNSWSVPLDKTRMKHNNKLAGIAWSDQDLDNAPGTYHSPLVCSFDRHKDALGEAANDLDYWLPLLISEAEEQDATEFLQERVASVREYLRTTFGLLIP
jgi:hypothetical protein